MLINQNKQERRFLNELTLGTIFKNIEIKVMDTNSKSTFENINELLKAILWPLIVVIVLTTYHNDVSDMFRKSSKVSLGSFSMEMQQEAKNQGSAELSKIIQELSVPGIKRLLSMGTYGTYGLIGQRKEYGDHEGGYTLSPDILSWDELIKADLVRGENFKIDELIQLFKNLKAEENTIYYDDQGSSSTFKDSKYPNQGIEYFIPMSKLNPELERKLEGYSIRLTDNGRTALDIIVETTARQIKKD